MGGSAEHGIVLHSWREGGIQGWPETDVERGGKVKKKKKNPTYIHIYCFKSERERNPPRSAEDY